MTLSCYNAVKRTSGNQKRPKINKVTLSCYNVVKRVENKRPRVVPLYADVVFVGDRSHSMNSTEGGSQVGATAYMRKQKRLSEKSCPVYGFNIEFITFDDKAETHFNKDASNITNKHISKIYKSMEPRGRTRLYDTAIEAIDKQIARVNRIKKMIPKDIQELVSNCPWLFAFNIAVMTDGRDNESIQTKSEFKNAVKQYRKNEKGVAFFIAANQDAQEKAIEYGFDPNNSLQMGNDRTSAISAVSATASAQYRSLSSGTSQYIPCYTQLERDASVSCNISMPYPPIPTLTRGNTVSRVLFP